MSTIEAMETRMQRGMSELQDITSLMAQRPLSPAEERAMRKISMLVEETAAALRQGRGNADRAADR
jgi:hypothetical protein